MAHVLSLLVPALIPSWHFFKAVEPSPRVQWQVMPSPQITYNWQEYRPRPHSVSLLEMLKRLFWNPSWNEALYMVSLSERLVTTPTQHSIDEIFRRLALESKHQDPKLYICFRLSFLSRSDGKLIEDILFQSQVLRLQDIRI